MKRSRSASSSSSARNVLSAAVLLALALTAGGVSAQDDEVQQLLADGEGLYELFGA